MTEAKVDVKQNVKTAFAKLDLSKYHKLVARIYEVVDTDIAKRTMHSMNLCDKDHSAGIVFRDGYVLSLLSNNTFQLLYDGKVINGGDRVHAILRSYPIGNSADMTKMLKDIYAVLPGTRNKLLYEQLQLQNKSDETKAPTVDITDRPPPYAPGGP